MANKAEKETKKLLNSIDGLTDFVSFFANMTKLDELPEEESKKLKKELNSKVNQLGNLKKDLKGIAKNLY